MNVENIKIWFTNLTQPHLIKIAILLGLSISLAITVLLWVTKTESALLISGLKGSEIAEVTSLIERQGITPQIEPSSGSIMVPPESVYEMRIKIAAAGYPKTPVEGYGLFDKQQTGGMLSRKDDDLLQRRVLEGELVRSILTIRGIENARVHLVIGSKNGLLRDKVESKASVVIKSNNGFELAQEQVVAIIHMVSTSVQGLDASKVSVIDHKGRLLSLNQTEQKMLANKNLNYKQKLEHLLTDRVEDMLGVVMGVENVKAQVHAEIDFSKRSEQAENFDPNSQVVRSQQTETSNQSGSSTVAGGAANNTEGGAGGGNKNKVDKETNVVNYEVDKLISTREYAGGVIERLTVSVVVNDHKTFNSETNKVEYQPLEQAELDRFTELAKASIGFSEARGDQIVLVNASFERPDYAMEMPVDQEQSIFDMLMPYIKYLLAFVVLLFTYLLVIRPLIKDISKASESSSDAAALGEPTLETYDPTAIENGAQSDQGAVASSLPGAEPQPVVPEKSYEDLHNELIIAVDKDVNLTAAVLKEWLQMESVNLVLNEDLTVLEERDAEDDDFNLIDPARG